MHSICGRIRLGAPTTGISLVGWPARLNRRPSCQGMIARHFLADYRYPTSRVWPLVSVDSSSEKVFPCVRSVIVCFLLFYSVIFSSRPSATAPCLRVLPGPRRLILTRNRASLRAQSPSDQSDRGRGNKRFSGNASKSVHWNRWNPEGCWRSMWRSARTR